MQLHISPSLRHVTVFPSKGFKEFIKVKVASRRVSYRMLFYSLLFFTLSSFLHCHVRVSILIILPLMEVGWNLENVDCVQSHMTVIVNIRIGFLCL